jgi:hypothetical protein
MSLLPSASATPTASTPSWTSSPTPRIAFDAYAAVLKPGGRGASSNSAAGDAPGRSNVLALPSPENLERVAQLLDAGALKVRIQDTYELDRAGEALQALGTTHTQGKLAIRGIR